VLLAVVLALVAMLSLTPALAQEPTKFTIGVSNSFVGSEWRTQMIQNFEAAAADLANAGIEIELVIESADTDAQGQIQQIENLINRGVDAIIINPGDQSALNLALEDAVAEGIVVIAIDQEIAAEGVYNVVIDQTEWARISARWLAEELGGEGDIVLIEGFVGHPANEARMAGVAEVLEEYPGITVVGRQSGMWDQATGQQVMSDFLASIPEIDGVWTQDGMAMGALTAMTTAGRVLPLSGEARAGYLQMWADVLEANPDFRSIGVVNPPGVASDGLRVAVEILLGGTVDESQLAGPFGNTLYVPIPYVITSENFAEYYEEYADAADSYTLDGMITQEQAGAFMVDGSKVVPMMGETEAAAEEPAATTPTVDPRMAELAGMGGASFTIGVSNSFVGSEWRTQMIQNFEAAAADLRKVGIDVELVIESADTDAQGQIQQIENLINRGVDAIIINPGDQSALNLALEDAVAEGIVVIAIDQEIAAEGVYNVVIDQTEWARISARWLAEELGGEGSIVLIEGFVGHPANEARMAGVAEVLEEYPGITVVGRQSGMWDQATGQQVMSDFLASIPEIDGVWTQDGMAMGALTAMITADRLITLSGEARVGYLKMWADVLETNPDFRSIGVVNPPGVAADGLRVAVEILLGGTVDESQLAGPFGNTLYVPIPYVITPDNFEEYYAEYNGRPDSYTLDGMITQSQAYAFMAK
jgi:ribose transport system substrate-binding protein